MNTIEKSIGVIKCIHYRISFRDILIENNRNQSRLSNVVYLYYYSVPLLES